MAAGEWYYCLDHKTVEPYEACKNDDRLGPYASQADAQAALDRAHERNESWQNDPVWNDPEKAAEKEAEDHWGVPPHDWKADPNPLG